MDFSVLTDLAAAYLPADLLASLAAFTVPVPDAALLALFAVILLSLQRAHRKANTALRLRLEAAYADELITAHRRGQSARADLIRAKREIEHERQRKRGLERHRAKAERQPVTRPVSVLRDYVATGTSRP
jgi:hypothetical protein